MIGWSSSGSRSNGSSGSPKAMNCKSALRLRPSRLRLLQGQLLARGNMQPTIENTIPKTLSLKETATLLVKHFGYHEGLYDIAFAVQVAVGQVGPAPETQFPGAAFRSEEHTSELQSLRQLVC